MGSKGKEILGIIADFVSAFFTTAAVILVAAMVGFRLLGWGMFTIDSSSMEPTYRINTLILVQNTAPENIRVGDVITYVANDQGLLVTHRVVDIDRNNRTFTTKGDANEIEDASPVLWTNTVGRVVLGIPWVGGIMRSLTAAENRPFVVGAIILLLLLSMNWDFFLRRKRRRKKRQADQTKIGREGDGGRVRGRSRRKQERHRRLDKG